MISANYHTHTVRCKHAVGLEREYIEAAISEGFKILGFSDHTPQPYPEGFVSGIRMDMTQLKDYTDTLVKLRDEYKDQIQILNEERSSTDKCRKGKYCGYNGTHRRTKPGYYCRCRP